LSANRILEEISAAATATRGAQDLVLVAIDGAGGSGKTTFARKLAVETSATVVEGDDFYRVLDMSEREKLDAYSGYMQYIDWQRFRSELLQPIRAGLAARCQRYDWDLNTLSGTIEVAPFGVIIIEGVYSCRPELREFYDLAVLVETPRAERLSRLRARGENSEEWIQRWDAAERWYFDRVLSKRGMDYIVSGSSAA